jgi:hypothetical protein
MVHSFWDSLAVLSEFGEQGEMAEGLIRSLG